MPIESSASGSARCFNFAQRLGLDLADALARHRELLADPSSMWLVFMPMPEADAQHALFARHCYSAADGVVSSPAFSISRRSHSGAMSYPFGQVGAPNSRNTR